MLGTTQPGFEPIRKPVEIDPGRAGYRIRDGDRFDRVDFQHRHRGRACEPVEEGLKANPQIREQCGVLNAQNDAIGSGRSQAPDSFIQPRT